MRRSRFTLSELLVTTVIIIILAAIFLGVLARVREKGRRSNCAGNLKSVGCAMLMYSGENDGSFPAANGPGNDLEPLNTVKILRDGTVYACPSATVALTYAGNSNYWYVGSGLKDDAKNGRTARLAYDSSGNHPGNQWMNCLFIDGHVEGARPDGGKTWNKYP